LPFSSLYVFLWLAFAPYSLGVWTVSLRKCILWTRRWIWCILMIELVEYAKKIYEIILYLLFFLVNIRVDT
jgi:hypothetical protein